MEVAPLKSVSEGLNKALWYLKHDMYLDKEHYNSISDDEDDLSSYIARDSDISFDTEDTLQQKHDILVLDKTFGRHIDIMFDYMQAMAELEHDKTTEIMQDMGFGFIDEKMVFYPEEDICIQDAQKTLEHACQEIYIKTIELGNEARKTKEEQEKLFSASSDSITEKVHPPHVGVNHTQDEQELY